MKYFGGGGGGGGGAVSSVFGRIGNVIAQIGDYAASLIFNDSSVSGTTVRDALNTLLAAIAAVAGSTVPTSRLLNATSPIRINGANSADLSADVTLSVLQVSNTIAGVAPAHAGAADVGKVLVATATASAWGTDFGAQPLTTTGPINLGTAPRASVGNARFSSGFSIRYRDNANLQDLFGIDFGNLYANQTTIGDSVTLVQAKLIASSRNVVVLARTTGDATATEIPAGAGDGIVVIEDVLGAPIASCAAGRHAYYSVTGAPRWRTKDGVIFSVGGEGSGGASANPVRAGANNANVNPVNTTSAAVVRINSFTPQFDNACFDLEATFIGKDAANRGISMTLRVMGKIIAGVITIEAQAAGTTIGNAALSTCLPSCTVAGGAFELNAAGVAATTIAWNCFYNYKTTSFVG